MNSEQFGKTYLRYEKNIAKVLRTQKIYDEDLLHDTYIALYEHSPHPKAKEFVNTFVTFYRNLLDWQNNRESQCDQYDNAQLAALNIIDTTDWLQRERSLQRLEKLLNYYYTHPQPEEHHHRRSCRILRLFLKGLSEHEISRRLKISQSAVCQSLQRTIERLKTYHSHITI